MDGPKYAVAEYENQQNHAKPKNLKTYIRLTFKPKGGWRLLRRPPFGGSIQEM